MDDFRLWDSVCHTKHLDKNLMGLLSDVTIILINYIKFVDNVFPVVFFQRMSSKFMILINYAINDTIIKHGQTLRVHPRSRFRFYKNYGS